MSLFQGSVGIGFLLGPVFGGVILAAASANTPFYIYGAVCLAFVPLCARAMRRVTETGRAHEVVGRASWCAMKPLLANSAYRSALGASASTVSAHAKTPMISIYQIRIELASSPFRSAGAKDADQGAAGEPADEGLDPR